LLNAGKLKTDMFKIKGELVLASGSPRRKEFFERLGLEYRIEPSGVNEDGEVSGGPAEIAAHWARAKARAGSGKKDAWRLGVDTIVVLDDVVMGKPSSREEAREFLSRLSGKWHEVISAYCIHHPNRLEDLERIVSSRVKIKNLSRAEIKAYIETGEPNDKAGGYAVQGIGAFMVERIEGSYSNVVGLPLTELINDLIALGVIEASSD
jgi:septum formation protein